MRWYFAFCAGVIVLYVFHEMMAHDCGYPYSLLTVSIIIVFSILFDLILEDIEKRKEQSHD